MMERRKLGRTNIEVSPIGFGCWAIGGPFTYQDIQAGWGAVDDNESIRAIHHAIDRDINLFDTAANYGTGHSESVLGRAVASRRDKVVIATKFGHRVDRNAKHVEGYLDPRETLLTMRASCEQSLRDLGTDYIDLFQLHVGEYPQDLAIELRDQLEQLVGEGTIRAYGWSTDSVSSAAIFAEGPHCAAIQHDLNVIYRAPDMLELCQRHSLSSLNRTPLARGMLTGKYAPNATFPHHDVRNDPWYQETFLVPTFLHLESIREVLTAGGRTLTQGALAWLLAISPVTIPIPGMRTVAQVDENADTMQLGPLTAPEMAAIEGILGAESLT
jgi:aryl-alcohol dehydrogenase-like predicted oxidoreductase